MRIVTNEALIKRNRRISQILFFFSLFVLIVGFVSINASALVTDMPFELVPIVSLILPAVTLPVALVTTLLSVRMTNLWIREPRPETAIEENLRALGKNAVLYNYYHFPARHVLITKHGVFAIITRFQDGKHSVTGDHWKSHKGLIGSLFTILRMDGIGNPTKDARAAAAHVQGIMDSLSIDVEVVPVVLFVEPRAKLTITEPTVAVLRAQTRVQPSFQDYLKKYPKGAYAELTVEDIQAFENATIH